MGNSPINISLELVPRSLESLVFDARVACDFEEITHLNIPHLERFAVSSIQAVSFLRKEFGDRFRYIPHILSKNINEDAENYFRTCLLVSGDHCSEIPLSHRETPDLLPLIQGARYVALDQYRGKSEDEISYLLRKVKNGAHGVFTQPFFSLSDVQKWNKKISRSLEVFYGISPVVSEKSKTYWEQKNKVVFPPDFVFSLEHNVSLAREIIQWAKKRKRGIYLMPIRVSVEEYLHGIFEK